MTGTALTVTLVVVVIAIAVYVLRRRPRVGAHDDEAKPSDARLLARILVSEIKLYHGREIAAARQSRDIYRRLQTDIERARQMFDAQFDPTRINGHDYFYEALVEILADGDATRLGDDGKIN
ncbi:MAG TPA: hypothetical protein VJH03_23370 [Blastocatellia bacterium]|nr:hypothetical protein [Blastocatellia bacterium]